MNAVKLDGKFHGVIVKNKDGSIVPQDEYVVFLAKDNAFPVALDAYYHECQRLNASLEQLGAIRELRDRLRAWRSNNPDKCKIPDVQTEEIIL